MPGFPPQAKAETSGIRYARAQAPHQPKVTVKGAYFHEEVTSNFCADCMTAHGFFTDGGLQRYQRLKLSNWQVRIQMISILRSFAKNSAMQVSVG